MRELEERCRNTIVYRKEITTDDPNIYAKKELEIEGVSEEGIAELRNIFNKFCREVEEIVEKETSPYK